jgi:hypothetical protein
LDWGSGIHQNHESCKRRYGYTDIRFVFNNLLCAASQYERSFSPKALSNWEVPDDSKFAQARFGRLPARTGKTTSIVKPNGHLKEGYKKPGVTAFTDTKDTSRPVYAHSKPRWPTKNVSWTWAPRATGGYKGIQTGVCLLDVADHFRGFLLEFCTPQKTT